MPRNYNDRVNSTPTVRVVPVLSAQPCKIVMTSKASYLMRVGVFGAFNHIFLIDPSLLGR